MPRQSAIFWGPLIALFTGMRLGEIIQLRVDDVREQDGILYFDARVAVDRDDDEGAKSLKNENSTRWIPIHPIMFAIGFGAFLDMRRTDGSVRLFPDFKQAKEDDSWSKTFTKWFGRYRRHLGVARIIGNRDRIGFHSFRHGFEDVVRNLPDVKKDVCDALQGPRRNRCVGRMRNGILPYDPQRRDAEGQLSGARSQSLGGQPLGTT